MTIVDESVYKLNEFPIKYLENLADGSGKFRLWIEDGRITGYMHGDDGKLMKEEIPAKTGNQDGD